MSQQLTERQQWILSSPQTVRQLVLETHAYESKIKEQEAAGATKDALTSMWLEIVTRKDKIKNLVGQAYVTPKLVHRSEKSVLNDLFRGLSGFTWAKSFGWVGQSKTPVRLEVQILEAPPDLYDCVVTKHITNPAVEETEIVSLELNGNGCDGELPLSISKLEKCEFLNLNWNLIVGNLPKSFSSLSQLKFLSMQGNMLSGPLDKNSVKSLKALLLLDLSFNNLSGPIPDVFENMLHLEELNLAGNAFSGNLPLSIASLQEIRILKLQCNELIGPIPTIFSSIRSLKEVNLSCNRLSKGLSSFSNCTLLEVLQLNDNLIAEHFGENFSKLLALDILYLQNNRISGILPESLFDLKQLRRLNVSNNELRGCIPDNIGNMTNLESFLLSNNCIVGPVPLSINNLTKLRDFHVFRPFPAEFTMPSKAFDRKMFDRIYSFAPEVGINSMHWDYKVVYGRKREDNDNESIAIFSGKL